MTKQDLWSVYTKRNPQFLGDSVTIKCSSLKKLFDQTWDQATKQADKSSGNMADCLSGMFGGVR